METDIALQKSDRPEEGTEHNGSSSETQDSVTKDEFKAPAPINTQSRQSVIPSVPYEKPDWSGLPKDNYAFEIIKGGISIDTIDVPSKEFLVLGRLPVCDISMEHTSISRYHAVIQFNSKGEIFIYDLESAHGTRLNKQRISPLNYVQLRVGDQLKFGESTRTYVLLGPEEPQQQMVKSVSKPTPEVVEITWGFAEDAEDESELSVSAAKESWKRDENAYYYKDPKKALRNWFENRGYDMEFESEQEGPGHARTFTSRIQLPDVEDAYGPVYGIGSGPKKRDADRQAAIDACEKLDMLGILRGGQDEALARKKRLKYLLGDDADDDENDSFYDRTGQAERSKLKKSQQTTSKVETYESLTKQREELALRIEELRNKISIIKIAESEKPSVSRVEDDLDDFMNSINNEINNESEASLQVILQDLLKQDQRLSRLIQFTKPHDIMKSSNNSSSLTPHEIPENSRGSIDVEKIENLTIKTEEIVEITKHEDSVMETSSSAPEQPSKTVPSKRVHDLPPGADEDNDNKKKVRSVIPMTPQEYEENQRKAMELNELEMEDAIVWEPPQGQTGDGRTSLNDKFGY